jgi:hypothetical protein
MALVAARQRRSPWQRIALRDVAGSINVNHAVRDRLQTINVNHAARDRLQTTAVAMVNALVGSGSGSGDFIDNT